MKKTQHVSITTTNKKDERIGEVFEDIVNSYINNHKEEFYQAVVDKLLEKKCYHMWGESRDTGIKRQICDKCHIVRIVK